MKAQLETILLSEGNTSFKYFKLEEKAFGPYWHYHPEFELTFIKRGKGLRFVGDHIGAFEDGDLVLLGKNLPHDWVSEQGNEQEDSVAYVIQFSEAWFSNIPEATTLQGLFGKAQYGLLFQHVPRTIIDKIIELEDLSPFKRLIRVLEIMHELDLEKEPQQLSSIAFHHKAKGNKYQSRTQGVTAYILERLEQPLKLEAVAAFSGMTIPAFCRWFKQAVGLSFVSYLHQVRIEKACHFLIQTDWRVSEIAFRTGFESLSHFNRTFKKLKMTSPSAYRKMLGGPKNSKTNRA